MITLIPCLEILKAFFDNNIQGQGAQMRIDAFQIANELTAECNFEILIPSQLFKRIAKRFEAEHKTAFETLYRVDYSTDGTIAELNLDEAIKLLAQAESKARGVIILTENISRHDGLNNNRIKAIRPEDFKKITTTVRSWKKRGQISSVDDALWINFFRDAVR